MYTLPSPASCTRSFLPPNHEETTFRYLQQQAKAQHNLTAGQVHRKTVGESLDFDVASEKNHSKNQGRRTMSLLTEKQSLSQTTVIVKAGTCIAERPYWKDLKRAQLRGTGSNGCSPSISTTWGHDNSTLGAVQRLSDFYCSPLEEVLKTLRTIRRHRECYRKQGRFADQIIRVITVKKFVIVNYRD